MPWGARLARATETLGSQPSVATIVALDSLVSRSFVRRSPPPVPRSTALLQDASAAELSASKSHGGSSSTSLSRRDSKSHPTMRAFLCAERKADARFSFTFPLQLGACNSAMNWFKRLSYQLTIDISSLLRRS